MRKIKRSRRGNTIAETPAVLYFLFIGMAFPLMAYASVFYRGLFLYFATRDSGAKAARASTFTAGQTAAQTAFTNDSAAWQGVTGTEQIFIVTKPLPSGTPTLSSSKLQASAINTTNNMYFIRAISKGSLQPLIPLGNILGLNVPGLTGPYDLSVKVDTYVENPSGLSN